MTTIDGTNLSGITIDGEEVQEITIDGEVAWRGVWESFESGDASNWTIVYGSLSATDAISAPHGDWSGNASFDSGSGNWQQQRRTLALGGEQISKFSYHWQETWASTGSALSFFNSAGDFELGLGSNQPQWMVDDGSGSTQWAQGDSEDMWIKFEVTFDWANGEYTLAGESPGGVTSSHSGTLNHGTDVARIGLGEGSWNSGGSAHFDNMQYE